MPVTRWMAAPSRVMRGGRALRRAPRPTIAESGVRLRALRDAGSSSPLHSSALAEASSGAKAAVTWAPGGDAAPKMALA